YATNSLLVVTILHAVINAIAAGMLLIMSMADITLGASRLVNTIQNIYMLAVLVLIVIGVVAFVRKIPTIRKYRIENAWVEIPPRRKIALFFISLPVIIMLVLAFNELTNFWVLTLFIV
ncbi:MAG: hypothetical protein FWB97_11200, partial [Oscillospiraceae bacterium]|nr:hypothetical protein [Oscillospiraceae bacterium]